MNTQVSNAARPTESQRNIYTFSKDRVPTERSEIDTVVAYSIEDAYRRRKDFEKWYMQSVRRYTEELPFDYKGYTLQKDQRNPYGPAEIMFYLTEDGIQHDGDYDGESYRYCGNCHWSSTIEEAKEEIDELVYRTTEK